LDANVLVTPSLTDLLLRLAQSGLLDPHWSQAVLDEAARAIVHVHPHRPVSAIQLRTDAMNRAFPYALVEAADYHRELFDLPDPGDRHVVAAARACEAEIIVTHNAWNFPVTQLAPHSLRAVTPDDLLRELFDQHPEQVIWAIQETAAATRNPSLSLHAILASLSRSRLPRFVAQISACLDPEHLPDAEPGRAR
jgi:predicted nucleic acid-binding protein